MGKLSKKFDAVLLARLNITDSEIPRKTLTFKKGNIYSLTLEIDGEKEIFCGDGVRITQGQRKEIKTSDNNIDFTLNPTKKFGGCFIIVMHNDQKEVFELIQNDDIPYKNDHCQIPDNVPSDEEDENEPKVIEHNKPKKKSFFSKLFSIFTK